MTIIYIVTNGEYSDYHIEGVFDDKARAELLCKSFPDGTVEEWTLNPEIPYLDKLANGLKCYNVYNYHNELTAMENNRSRDEEFLPENIGEEFFTVAYVFAKDEQHAIKIAAEKIAKYIYEKDHDGIEASLIHS